jgi:PmbA protein
MDLKEFALEVIDLAMRAGATAAEVTVREGVEFSTVVRLGAVEKLLQADFRKLGLRTFCGNRTAVCATSDFSGNSLRRIVSDTLDMAKTAGEDPASELPAEDFYRKGIPPLQLCFPEASQLPPDAKIAWARRAEQAAMRFDPLVCNSEGAGFSDSLTQTAYANSLGSCAAYGKSVISLAMTPMVEKDGQKQRDSWLTTHLDLSRLQSPEEIGVEAARRALRRLGARKVDTCEVPILFDPRAAATVLKHISEAVSGTALLRKASFLMDQLGKRIASPLVTIYDDALLPGGLGSRPFDAEGIPSQSTTVIHEGVLENFLLDSYSGRKLGMRTTGNSDRDLHAGHSAGPSNFYLKAGTASPADVIATIRKGLYVTELMGFGVNIVSETYSQGAAGLWIENGELAFPVEEVTIAGNLKDMLTGIEAVGNDLLALGAVFAPSLLIGKMMVSGT